MVGPAMVALTDYNWYKTLERLSITDEVNFWTPTPWDIKRLKADDTVYLLLKEAYGRTICGFGKFKEYKNMEIETAWEEYGLANGVKTLAEMKERVAAYTNRNSKRGYMGQCHKIGCMILKNVEFIDSDKQRKDSFYGWNIPKQVVKYKYVAALNMPVNTVLNNDTYEPFTLVKDQKKYKQNRNAERKGQNKFRSLIFNTYEGKCCITGETIPVILQAAHIQSYISEASNHIQNGILLRVDLHNLFDAGLLSINEEYIVRVSRFLTSTYYGDFDGKKIWLPDLNEKPSIEAIRWHNENVFRK